MDILEELKKQFLEDERLISSVLENCDENDIELSKPMLEYTISYSQLKVLQLFSRMLKTQPALIDDFLTLIQNNVLQNKEKVENIALTTENHLKEKLKFIL